MASVLIGFINILESSTVTATSTTTGYPLYRLYDRKIGLHWKATSTAKQDFDVDQGAITTQIVNALVIPPGHNLDGESLRWYYSSDGATYTSITSWTQSGNGLIYKTTDDKTYRFWRVRKYLGSAYVTIPELFLTYAWTFTAQPLKGGRLGGRDNVIRSESPSGVPQYVILGNDRKVFEYDLIVQAAEKATVDLWIASGTSKPFFVSDYEGNQYFGELLERPIPQYVSASAAQYSVRIQEVL